MLKLLISLFVLCTFQSKIYAQDKVIDTQAASISNANCVSVDALSSYIKQNFTTDSTRVRAIYVWIANHINYDFPRFLARDKNPGSLFQPVADVLSTRMAVCQGYAELFVALCKGVGVNAIVIPGYTKKQGKVSPVSHAWVAAELSGNWYLFDPTWGAGYIRDEQYVRKFNNTFYKMLPANAIADHIPFDPLYQFLSYPVTHKEFIDGKPGTNKTLFNYNDSLKLHNQFTFVQQNAAELRRLEAQGIQNDLLKERQLFLKQRLQAAASKNAFDEGNKVFSGVMTLYKEYIGFKNNQFSAIGDNDLRKMIEKMEQSVILSRSLFSEAIPKTDAQQNAKTNNLANAERFWQQLSNEKQFVQNYLVADKAARRQLFMKRK